MTVRVRFAPSPTGYLHIGGIRTALFNWMFARKHGGDFLLRIEDTDRKRYVEGSIEYIMDSLRWLGMDWDEGPDIGGDYGPYVQSERLALYQEWANWLIENGHAYKCFCSAERLAEVRKKQMAEKTRLGYDRHCRNLSAEEIAEKEASGAPYVVRFKMPLDGETIVHDEIRGDITFQNETLDDRVLMKSDGFPTYHLANVIDDHFMAITHIMRGDEWISTAPLHVNLYKAFNWQMPAIGHLPVILSPSGKGKLSKRDQAFKDGESLVLVKTLDYRSEGYLPEAVTNWLANVGWSYGNDVEKYDVQDAIPRFTIPAINPSPTKLPFSKLEWLNSQHILDFSAEELAQYVKPYLDAEGLEISTDALTGLMPALSVRLKRFPDAIPFLTFLNDDGWAPDEGRFVHKKMAAPQALSAFRMALEFMENNAYDVESLGEAMRAIGEAHTENGKAGPFLGTMRYAMTGQKVSPPLFESIIALGHDRALSRLATIISRLENLS